MLSGGNAGKVSTNTINELYLPGFILVKSIYQWVPGLAPLSGASLFVLVVYKFTGETFGGLLCY